MPFADVHGLRLYYERHGAGPPLVCVMGLGCDHQAWALQLPDLAERFETVVFDNRDTGRSTICETDYELADLAADVLGLADALGLRTFHLLGISLGSAVAQLVALGAPERVQTLTLAATWAGTAPAYARLRAAVWEREVRRSTAEEWLDEMLLLTLSERLFEHEDGLQEIRRLALDDPHPQPTDALIRQIRATSHHDVRDRLGELRMPVHVIAGDRDVLIPAWKSAEVAERVPGATLTVLKGVGHALNLERADEFNAAILGWLTEQVLGSGRDG